MAEQDAARRAREVGDQIEKQANQLADAGAAQADALADQAKQQLDAAQASAQNVAESVQSQAQDVSETLSGAGQDAQKQAKALSDEGLAKLRDTAQKVSDSLSDSVDQAARATGGTLRGAASGVRAYAPESGTAADFTERLASGLERSGAYLEQQGDGSLVDRMGDWVRRHPLAVTLAGGGLLFLLLRGRRRG